MTIIILLILVGVTINLTIGEKGLFKTTQDAAIEHKKAQLKEEIELEIINIQSRKYANQEEISRENLYELSNIGATVKTVEIPAEGEYKDYHFEVDENYKVTILNKTQGEKPTVNAPVISITDVTPLGFTVVVNNNYDYEFIDEYKYYVNGNLVSNNIKDTTYKVQGLYEGTEYSVYVEACTSSGNIKSNVVTTTTQTVTRGIRFNGGTAVVTNLAQSDIYADASKEYTVALRVKINRKEQSTINYMGMIGLHDSTRGIDVQFHSTSTLMYNNKDYTPYYDKWTDIVRTYNNGIYKIYLNGELLGSNTNSRDPYPSNLVIGNSYRTDRYMKGSICSVKVWSKELTENELRELDMGQENTAIQAENLKLETMLDSLEEIQRIGTMQGSNYQFLSNE